MKSTLATVLFSISLVMTAFSDDRISALTTNLLNGVEELKTEYRTGLAEIVKESTKFVLYQLDLRTTNTTLRDRFNFPEAPEGFFEVRGVEYKIKDEKIITGDSLEQWKSALHSLMLPEDVDHSFVVSGHRTPETVLVVYAKDSDNEGEESAVFHFTFSWSDNNYRYDYPFVNWDIHPIIGAELKELIRGALPRGNYEYIDHFSREKEGPTRRGSQCQSAR